MSNAGRQLAQRRGHTHLDTDQILYSIAEYEVARGKPHPDIFVEAARRIGVDPRDCRAYEDGESGLIAAHAAGCHVIDVTFMDEYPTTGALKRAKAAAERQRSWLVDGTCPKLASSRPINQLAERAAAVVVAGAILLLAFFAMRR